MSYRILAYHAVGHYPRLLPSGIGTGPAEFARQLDWLLSTGHHVVPLDALLGELAAGRTPPAPDVALTFDDGYVDCLEHAVPALIQRGLPATFFVSAGLLGQRMPLDHTALPIFTPAQVTKLAGLPGVTIGSHGDTHRALNGLPADALARELSDSRRRLEDLAGRPVRWLSYPFGAHDAAVAAAARAAGYEDALSVWTRAEGPFARLRIPVHTHDGPVRFALKLSRAYYPVKRWLRW